MKTNVAAFIAANLLLLIHVNVGLAQPASNSSEKQAAYCMEASFGYLQQATRLLAVLRSNRDNIQTLANNIPASQADREKIAANAKIEISKNIASNEARRDRWKSDLDVYLAYLERHKILGAGATDLNVIKEMSAKVREDQIAVSQLYATCLKACDPTSTSCKADCNTKADTSEPSKRMLHCGNIVGQFKQ